MTGDLVERLRSHDYDHAYNLKTDEELYAERDEAADRIAALEAKLAEKDALLRECGEALERARNAMWLAIDQLPTCYAQGVCGHEIEIVRITLAKIKDATDAD